MDDGAGPSVFFLLLLRARCRFRMKPSMLPPANAIFESTTRRCNLAHLSLSIYRLFQLPDTEDLQSQVLW